MGTRINPVLSGRRLGLKRGLLALSAVVFGLAANPAHADGLQVLQDFLQHSSSGRADFVQKVTAPPRAGQAPRVKTSRGRLAYQRPDLFRLDYVSPDEQTLLADGRQFWHLDADLQQVTARNQKAVLAQAPAALILTATDVRALQTAFDLRSLPDADGLSWVEVNPKVSDGTLRQLRVGLRGQGKQAQIAVLEFADGFGQTSRLEFSGFVSGPALPASTFVLKPPPGYQVLRP
jgi:outer membrane lipoprotein carrier protein